MRFAAGALPAWPDVLTTVAAYLANMKAQRLCHVDHAALRVVPWPCIEAQAAEFFLDLLRDNLRSAIRCFRLEAPAKRVEQIEPATGHSEYRPAREHQWIIGVQPIG
ncbi:hypothetical protein [Paraburkholderia ultramafica]|uniref:hypothetical protein n=1 Tax=Paraburkholderia ultramafica TaxID=1544867 RepID=UPI0015841100|nr:hypothetical protein [Paraburkholderia ultramafica]